MNQLGCSLLVQGIQTEPRGRKILRELVEEWGGLGTADQKEAERLDARHSDEVASE